MPLLTCLGAAQAGGRTLTVGIGGEFARPGQAAVAAQAGDRVEIAAGTYYDCAVWGADRLLIEGAGSDTTRVTDTTCQGKAIFVVTGRGVTVRNLTLARARVADGNGAGIRAEGADLLVQGVRFENNQEGLLAAAEGSGSLRLEDCVFQGNGVPGSPRQTADLAVGAWPSLVVRATRFQDSRGQAAILSRAARTEIDDVVETTPPEGASVQASGELAVTDSALMAGGPAGRHAAILALPGGPGGTLLLRGNRLQGPGTLLLNWSGRPAVLDANRVPADGTEASSAGAWLFRARLWARHAYDVAHHVAAAARRRVLSWIP